MTPERSIASAATVPVLAMPAFSPDIMRNRIEVAPGTTIAGAIDLALPGLGPADRERLAVSLVSPNGDHAPISRQVWHRVRPRPGVLVTMRLMPSGEDALRNVLLAVVSVAAVAAGQIYGPALLSGLAGTIGAGAASAIGTALVTTAVLAAGSLLVNAFLPPSSAGASAADRQRGRPSYQISSWQNQLLPNGAIPEIFGRHRYAPPFAAPSYTEIVGDDLYVRAILNCGYGPLAISDIKIGETPISAFDEVTVEIRQGYATDEPISLYPRQVIEENLGIELRRDLPRDDAGEVIAGAAAETPIIRYSATDATGACVILGFRSGLVAYADDGKAKTQTVTVRIRQRPVGSGTWTNVDSITYSAKKGEQFFRDFSWEFPARGRYEIELTRMTDERTSIQQADSVAWVALQSFRPEYPIATDIPLALIGLRIKSTHQLNGPLQTVNAVLERIAPDWNGDAWVQRTTRNPASAYRWALQNAWAYPVPDAGIDLNALADWHDYCALKGLKYDQIRDFNGSIEDLLREIADAGRAAPYFDGERESVIIDRPQDLVIDHVNPRNSDKFSWKRTYFDPPDALLVPFLDETADFASRERIVPWPGQTGDIDMVEEFQLPGKTDPDEIWIETRRRQYEASLRADSFEALQPGAARTATRGDFVKLSHYVLDGTQAARRIKSVHGDMVALDAPVEMEAGTYYACRYQVLTGDGDGNAVAANHLRPVIAHKGVTDAFRLDNDGDMPEPGTIVHFGVLGEESTDVRVQAITAGEDLSSVMTFKPAADEIEALLDAEAPPPWNGRAGGSIANDTTAPATPVITNVEMLANGATVLVSPGSGSAVPVATYVLEHRLVGAGAWTAEPSVAAGAGSVSFIGYDAADEVEFHVKAVSLYDVSSAFTATVARTIPTPAGPPLPIPSASVAAGLGWAQVSFSTASDEEFAKGFIWRGPDATFANAEKIAEYPGLPGSTYAYIDGDATVSDLVTNGGFASADSWTEGTGWAIAAGAATKTPGSTGNLTQDIAFVSGATYRFRLDISGATAGQVQIALRSGTEVTGAIFDADGTWYGEIVADAGNTKLSIEADADFDGSIDNLVLFKATPTSLAQGTYHYFLTAANADDPPLESAETPAGGAIVT